MSGCVTVTGPPAGDLLLEDRHRAAAAPEHVAEADGDEHLDRPASRAASSTISSAMRFEAPITDETG
jgi:hypothetical protein